MQGFTITNAGKQLMARMIAGATTANFTKVVASDHDYSGVDLEALTELQDIKQEVFPSDLSVEDATSIRVVAVFDNSEITQRYYVRAVGLYAEEADGTETLYAVSICDETPDSMPGFGGKTVYSLTYEIYIRVDSTDQMTLELNPLAYVTVKTLTRMINETKALRATPETYGMVKMSDASDVTDATGLALSAAEKNPELEGTLANQIKEANTALAGKASSTHTHSAATTSVNGFMSSADKTKLNGIASGANKTTVDSALSSSSTNPVQNKVVDAAIKSLGAAVIISATAPSQTANVLWVKPGGSA